MFRFRQRDLSYVELLKQSVSEEEWTALRGELLAAPSLRFQRRELQMREGMQEKVLKEIEDSNCPSSILDYEKNSANTIQIGFGICCSSTLICG